jgi:hypothetical protein
MFHNVSISYVATKWDRVELIDSVEIVQFIQHGETLLKNILKFQLVMMLDAMIVYAITIVNGGKNDRYNSILYNMQS